MGFQLMSELKKTLARALRFGGLYHPASIWGNTVIQTCSYLPGKFKNTTSG